MKIQIAPLCVLIASSAALCATSPIVSHWTSLTGEFPGVASLDGLGFPEVDKILQDRDGSILVGGAFERAGDQRAMGIARWKNNRWAPVGEGISDSVGMTNMRIGDLKIDSQGRILWVGDVDIYHGPILRRFDGTKWQRLEKNLGCDPGKTRRCRINTIDESSNGRLVISGEFSLPTDTVGQGFPVRMAELVGDTAWVLAPKPPMSDITWVGKDASGRRMVAGYGIAIANGSGWSYLGQDSASAASTVISAIRYESSDKITIAGDLVGLGADWRVAQWNGTRWNKLASSIEDSTGPAGGITAIEFDPLGRLLLAGIFYREGKHYPLVRRKDNSWERLGDSLYSPFGARVLLQATDGMLYMGGSFAVVGGVAAEGIVEFVEGKARSMGDGQCEKITMIASDRRGGWIAEIDTLIGEQYLQSISRWSNGKWSRVWPELPNAAIHSLLADGHGGWYMGGSFTKIDSLWANHIAHWNGQSWSALGAGLTESAECLSLDSAGNLVAAGFFGASDTTKLDRLGRWNGTAWQNIWGSKFPYTRNDMNPRTMAIQSDGTVLVAGYNSSSRSDEAWVLAESGSPYAGFGSYYWSTLWKTDIVLAADSGRTFFAGEFHTLPPGMDTVAAALECRHAVCTPIAKGFTGGRSMYYDKRGFLYIGGYGPGMGYKGNFSLLRWDGTDAIEIPGIEGTVVDIQPEGDSAIVVLGNLYGGNGSRLARLSTPWATSKTATKPSARNSWRNFTGSGTRLATTISGKLEIHDLSGRTLLRQNVSAGFRLSSLRLPQGVYHARLEGESIRFTPIAEY